MARFGRFKCAAAGAVVNAMRSHNSAHFLCDRQLFPAVLHRTTLLHFFQAIAKRTLSSFFCGRTWASRCPKPAHLHLFALFLQTSSYPNQLICTQPSANTSPVNLIQPNPIHCKLCYCVVSRQSEL